MTRVRAQARRDADSRDADSRGADSLLAVRFSLIARTCEEYLKKLQNLMSANESSMLLALTSALG